MTEIAFPSTSRADVAQLHEALALLGLQVSEAEVSGRRVGASTRAAVARVQADRGLPVTGRVDEATARAIETMVAELEAPVPGGPGGIPDGPQAPDSPAEPAPVPAPRRVTGTVRHADGSGLGGLLVHAFHRQVGGELPLGNEALTGDRGRFAVPYELPDGVGKVDLFVRAFADQAVVAVSPIAIGAREQEVLDLVVTDPRLRGPAEFARVTEALRPHVAGADLADLDANDVGLLVRNTGVQRRTVTAWIAAQRLAGRTGADPESLYGLIRIEATTALPRLLRRSPARLRRALTGAAEANIVSAATGTQAEATVARLRRLAVDLSVSQTPGSLGALLATCATASPAQQAEFVARYADHEGPAPQLWAQLRADAGFGPAVVEDLQLTLRLGMLTANHPPLVRALRAAGVRHAGATAALGRDGWRRLLRSQVDGTRVGVPPVIRGGTAAEREGNYLVLLTERSARAYPTAHVAKALKALPDWRTSTAAAFLDTNPDVNLLTADLRSTVDDPGVVVRPEWDRATLQTELATVQRVSRVAPRGREEPVVQALLGSGYTSALAIGRQSRATFRRRTAAALGDDADTVHRNAQLQVARAATGFALMHPDIGAGTAAAIAGASAAAPTDPTWTSLFGGVDHCACPHCRSIYGPAAYLVELLSWLDGHDAGARTAFDRLTERRPDLQRIELSCDNTNTVLPYVDLLNEILEVRVVTAPGAATPAVPQATTGLSAELLADPEHLLREAYDDHLAKAVFPHLLPFDLWGRLGRVYFEHLGVRRSDLMETLDAARARTDAERLGLSTAQWRILAGADRRSVWAHWGYRSATVDGADYKADLAVVSTFLDRAAVDYDQLLDLARSRFVSAGGLRVTGSEADTDAMTIGPLTDDVLDRTHRFLRLWRNRGWSILELDKTLSALGIGTLDAAALGRLADLDRVLAATGAPLLEALSWWAPMDTRTDRPEKDQPVPSLYDRVYLNRSVDAAAEDPAFPLALDAARTGLANEVRWDDVRPLLQAALMVDADDLALLLDETLDPVTSLPNDDRVVTGTTADLAGLSAVYRHVTLARRLRLTVGELLGLLHLTGLDPFDGADPDALVRFVETVADVRAAEFSLPELHYLLEHDAVAETGVGVTDEVIGQTLVELRDGLARVATDFAVVADPMGEATARCLAVLLDADAVAAVMTELRTEAATADAAVLTDNLAPFVDLDAAALLRRGVEERFGILLGLLVPLLRRTQGDALIIEKIAGFAGRELDSVADLLGSRLRMTVAGAERPALTGLRTGPYTGTTAGEIVPADDEAAFAVLRRTYKVGLVLSRLGLDLDGQVWLFDVGVRAGLYDPAALPVVPEPVAPGSWDRWTRLVDLAALAVDLPGGEPGLVDLLTMLESAEDRTAAEAAFRTELTARTGWSAVDLETLTGTFAPAFPAGWRDGRTLRALVDAFALTGRLGVAADQALGWATADIGADQAEQLRLAAKSKHDEERWPAVARALRDPVREEQRAALVGYLVAADPSWADPDDLYADLLIDAEMAPCMLTSRIKQAISTVQLFVQRCFLNLEDGIELDRDDSAQWEWMKNYRVWEAARKVFLYPENWTEPELRIDKSPLFQELENTLRQGELDDVAAERAYTDYLEGLQKIARLEVMGLYHQLEEDGDGTVDVLHVVARTRCDPHEYYYRQWIDGREWTAWEPFDADIEGDQVVLAVHDRRLYVFWPVVVQKATADATGADEDNPPDQIDFYEMQLGWIERMNDHWGARKISTGYLTVPGSWELDRGTVYFRLRESAALSVDCLLRADDLSLLLGTFSVEPSSGDVLAAEATKVRDDIVPYVEKVAGMRFASLFKTTIVDEVAYPAAVAIASATRDTDGVVVSGPEEVVLLTPVSNAITTITYAYPHQYEEFTSQHGVFLDDDDRTFHVMPAPALVLETYDRADQVQPSDVGTAAGGGDVFVGTDRDIQFEPDLNWALAQDGKTTGTLVGATADDLSADALRQSQGQLVDTSLEVDSLLLDTSHRYQLSLFYHPYVGDFLAELRRSGVTGLLDPNPDGPAPRLVRQEKSRDFFADSYETTDSVLGPLPIQDIDFEVGGAYAKYNWELFFHAPMLIAGRLTADQRFAEARRWFHFMFDPTNRTDEDDPLRFWKIKPFHHAPDAPIEEFLALAASTVDSPEAEQARLDYDRQIEAALADPFDPHRIAELRTTAYQKTLVMKYLDNLVAWGDQLFRQDTIESINEATQLYVLALELLGERPDALPPRTAPVPTTYEQVRGDLAGSVLTNPLVQLENVLFLPRTSAGPVAPVLGAANSWGTSLFPAPHLVPDGPPTFYFGIPPNEKLLGYWDIVADRLFKIRHCMNIEGVVRQLPLFEPPIDPAMLVRARAAGVDLSSVLADMNAPLPFYRFTVLLQRAQMLNQTVRALGGALLGALEKGDAEALSGLRADQEVAVLEAVRQVKDLAIEEARHSLTAAQRSLTVVEQRRDYYQRLIDAGWLPDEELQKDLMDKARTSQSNSSRAMMVGGAVAAVPEIVTGVSGYSGTPVATSVIVAGLSLAKVAELGGQALALDAAAKNAEGALAGLTGGHRRRDEEWAQQLELATRETGQIEKQIEAAGVRLALAERDRANHERQVENARSVRELMEQKFTNVELYQWMVGQLSTLYFQSYQLAYDLAKRAERGYQHELALPAATFIQFGYWDSLRKGLLSGERLQRDIERMDAGYLDNNRREYELTRHVSLALLDPVALVQLRTAGACEFSVPESFYDLDHPGQYLRRIKSVSVTVPCVTGPYTGVPMRLTLVSSRTRVDPTAAGRYPMETSVDDVRFQLSTGAVESIVVSGGREDAGLFAADLRDERYLPFEGAGAVSDWNLVLTSAVPTFDWDTITDVVLTVRYTAREGGDLLRTAALASLGEELDGLPLRRAFSARSEFPSEWNAFLRPAEGAAAVLDVQLSEQLFPFFAHGAGLTITRLEVIALVREPGAWRPTDLTVATAGDEQTVPLTGSAAVYGGQPNSAVGYPGAPPGGWTLTVPAGSLGPPAEWADDLILVVDYHSDLAAR